MKPAPTRPGDEPGTRDTTGGAHVIDLLTGFTGLTHRQGEAVSPRHRSTDPVNPVQNAFSLLAVAPPPADAAFTPAPAAPPADPGALGDAVPAIVAAALA